MLQQYLGLCLRGRRYLRSLSPRKRQFLQATILSIKTLICTYLLALTGLYQQAEHCLIQCLAGHPFYMTAMEAQNDLLSPSARGWLSIGLVFYLSYVLLGEGDRRKRAIIITLSLVAMLFASFSAVFWGGILNLFAPMSALCILTLGLNIQRGFAYYLRQKESTTLDQPSRHT